MPVAHALPVRHGFGIVCRLAVLPRVAINADRPKVLGYFLAAFRVPDDVISAPVAWLGRNKIDRRSAHVTGEALTAEQIEPCVSVNADAAGSSAVAVPSGTCANVSTFPALRWTGEIIWKSRD